MKIQDTTEPHVNLTARHLPMSGTDDRPKWAVFLPAISSFYSSYVGRQRHENYVDATRMPAAIPDMEQLNFLNDKNGLFHYKWGLYSAGHANLDLSKFDPKEDMIRNRDPATKIVADSGGFQIGKTVWEGDWKNPNDPKSSKKREEVLKWLDGISDYAMTLDIPTWIIENPLSHQKSGISTYQEAVDATIYNNEYFIKHRKGWQEGGTKFLNVLQGANHTEAEQWYQTMKKYCDPKQYPNRHFNGWAFGGQNMCSVSLMLKRFVTLMDDNLLEEGIHDWIHVLGTSKLEWAIVLTELQNAVRKYHNPNLIISFDCASPFLATANGQIYVTNEFKDRSKWTYRMAPSVDDKKYATDNRPFRDVMLQDEGFGLFDRSPISDRLKISDVCCYAPGALNKLGKEGKTSWDSFSYMLMMIHNVHRHIDAVQTANELYESGLYPSMLIDESFDRITLRDIVEQVFTVAKTAGKEAAYEVIEYYDRFFTRIIGTRGATGKKETNASTYFGKLFEVVKTPEPVVTEEHHIDDSGLDETNLEKLEIGEDL